MGGNVVMLYAGLRPQRIRRLINLEGFGMPDMPRSWPLRAMKNGLNRSKSPPA